MCTVSFVPQPGGGFVFTSNRDEAPDRSAVDLCEATLHGQQVLYPRDSGAGGTWIAVSNSERLVCVLNGAFALHERTPPYRRSRGLMVLDTFGYTDFPTFARDYDFANIEPFTLIGWQSGALYELRWDGEQTHLTALRTDQSHLWSSATLYDPAAQNMRHNWFRTWQSLHQQPSPDDVMEFHTHAGAGDPWNGVIMNRMNLVCTVSITQLVHSPHDWQLMFRELLTEQISTRHLPHSRHPLLTT